MTFFKSHSKHLVAISPQSLLMITAFGLGLVFTYQVRNILTLLFLAFIIMTALHPFVDFLQKKTKMPRPAAIFAVYMSVIAFFSTLIGVMVPLLVSELYQLVRTVDIPFFQNELSSLQFTVSELSQVVGQVGDSVGMIFTIITSTFSSVFTVFTLMVMSFYLMLDRPHLHKKVAWISKDKKHLEMADKYIDDLEHQLGGWVRGQVILMLLIGFIIYIGLFLLGIPYALPLALLAGLFEIVPNIGPVMAAIPAVIFGYVVGGPFMGGVLVIFYLVIQQLENNIVVPRIMKQSADVNPLISIVAILMGLKLGGVVGALLGVPIYIVFRATYSIWFKHQSK
jgi:predicted PurR-regulated permease PerM